MRGGATPYIPTYYVDASNAKNVITCTYNGSCISTDYVSSLPSTEGTRKYFINSAVANTIIMCISPNNSGICTASSTPFTYVDTAIHYFIDGGDPTGKSIIQCDAVNQCITINNNLGGIYITDVEEEKFIRCDGNKACTYSTTSFTSTNTIQFDSSSNTFKYRNAKATSIDIAQTNAYEILSAEEATQIFNSNSIALVKVTPTAIIKGKNNNNFFYILINIPFITLILIFLKNNNNIFFKKKIII